MRALIKEILDGMKDKVMSNLSLVKENEADMRKYLMNKETYGKAFDLQMHFGKNRKLLNENLDYLELQLKLVNLVNKYGRHEFMKMSVTELLKPDPAQIDYFAETISGNMTFNENHPYYRDTIFISQLIEYYQKSENYEKCQMLNEIKKLVSD